MAINAIDMEFIKANFALRFNALVIFILISMSIIAGGSQWPIDTQTSAIHYLMTQILKRVYFFCHFHSICFSSCTIEAQQYQK